MKVIDAIRNIYNPKRSHAGIWCDLPPSSFDSTRRREGTQLQFRHSEAIIQASPEDDQAKQPVLVSVQPEPIAARLIMSWKHAT